MRLGGSCAERGATLVEFAIVAPLLFLLLFGVIELGRGVAVHQAVTTAAREAARFGTTVDPGPAVRPFEDCDGIRNAAFSKTPLLDPSAASITVTYDNGGVCPAGGVATAEVEAGDRIIITVETTFRSPVPIISNLVGDLQMSSTQRRTIYPGSP